MKKVKFFFLSLFAASMMLSCSNGDEDRNNVEYLAVQLEEGEDWSIIDGKGEVIVKEEYSKYNDVSAIFNELYWVQDDEGYHLYHIDDPKKPLTKDVYEYATLFADGRAVVAKRNEPINIINEKGEVVKKLDENICEVSAFSDGLATFMDAKSQKTGYIDTDGEVVLEAKYAAALPFHDGLAFVSKKEGDKKFFIINKNGEEKGSFNTENLMPLPLSFYFKDGMLPLWDTKTDKLVFIDETGQSILKISGSKLSPGNFYAGQFRNDLIIYSKDDDYGLVNKEGEVIIRPKYTQLAWINDNMLVAEKNDKSGLIDTEDNTIVDFEYSSVFPLLLNQNPIFKDKGTYYIYDLKEKKILQTEFYRASVSDASDSALYTKSEFPEDTEAYGDSPNNNPPADSDSTAPTELGDYAFLSTSLLTEDDIFGLSKADIRILRNAIFARHGYIFSDPKLAEHFSQFPWYVPVSKDVAGELNSIEQQNVAFLKAHE